MKLKIFDFDATLYRSPVPNRDRIGRKVYGRLMSKSADGSGHGWFQDPITLSAKYTSDVGVGFIDHVVADAKAAIADPDVYTVLLTGRGEMFRDRVIELCESVGLAFSEYFLKPDQKETTGDFKVRVIDELIATHSPSYIEMWEDRPKHIAVFDSHLSKIGIAYDIHHVERGESYMSQQDEVDVIEYLIAKYPVANVSTRPNYYAVVLDDASQSLLKHSYDLPNGWVWCGHHMTIVVGNKYRDRYDLIDYCDASVGQEITLVVDGYAETDRVKAIRVRSIPEVPTQNAVSHITLCHSTESKPRESNDVSTWQEAEYQLMLNGKISAVY